MFEIRLNIHKITLMTGQGPDKIIIHTDLPDGCFPYTGKQTFETQTAAKGGVEYIKKHFHREPDEVVDIGWKRPSQT